MLKFHLSFLAIACALPVAAAEPDFDLGGKTWRCVEGCRDGKTWASVKVEQTAAKIVVTDETGAVLTGEASTNKTEEGELTAALRCKLNPSACGKPGPASFSRSIRFTGSTCYAVPRNMKGKSDTPPPFKPITLSFNGKDCALREVTWTTLSNSEWKKYRAGESW